MILHWTDEGIAPSYVDADGCLCLAPTVVRVEAVERAPNPLLGLLAVLLSGCVVAGALWFGLRVVGPGLYLILP